MSRWISTAQRTASTTLENSTSSPSPVVLTMRPWCSAILRSISSVRCALKRALLVDAHQPAVADDVRREDGAQLAGDVMFLQNGRPFRQRV
jgi:hypothetical protein